MGHWAERCDYLGSGPSAAAKTDLGSCHFGNCIFGKLPLVKNILGKYLTSEARLDNSGCIYLYDMLRVDLNIVFHL